jgi:hypothetical protein
MVDKPFPGPCVGHAPHVSEVLSPEHAAHFARQWLHRCQEQHEACRKSQILTHSSTLPTRVLDVGLLDAPYDKITLVEQGGLTADYLALSYCWGRDQNFVTTTENIRDRFAGISFEELPKTFQDAVEITRHMGVRYLWIDALCIIQDDNEDWDREAANMDCIYEGSLLTLSATCSGGVNQGFLRARRSSPNFPIQKSKLANPVHGVYATSWTMPTGLKVPVSVRQRLSHSVIVSETADAKDHPLLARGWVFQERLLATRTLHFLSQELLWECRCQYWCECGGVSTDQMWKSDVMQGSVYNKVMCGSETADLTAVWQSLVTNYSRRLLTYERDRLPALSGVAYRFNRLGMGSYLAGLWQKDLLWNLIWQADHASRQIGHNRQRTLETVAGSSKDVSVTMVMRKTPSWSWISTPLPIRWKDDTFRILESCGTDLEVLDAQCELDGADPMGRVLSGKLRLKARVTSVSIESIDNDYYRITKSKHGPRSHDATLIPDLPSSESGLVVGDGIYCIHMFSYNKDGGQFWVALAVQSVDFPKSTPFNETPLVALSVQPEDFPKSITSNNISSNKISSKDIPSKNSLFKKTDKPRGFFSWHRNSRANLRYPSQRKDSEDEPYLNVLTEKKADNYRDVYTPNWDDEGHKDEIKETFTRVGLIEGRRLPGPISVDWFKDIKPREIFII